MMNALARVVLPRASRANLLILCARVEGRGGTGWGWETEGRAGDAGRVDWPRLPTGREWNVWISPDSGTQTRMHSSPCMLSTLQ